MSGILASTAAAVGIIDKAVGIAKKLADDSGELDKATLKLELANLMSELASVKMEVITTQALLFDAEQKNKLLEDQLKDKSTFIFKDNVYWKAGDDIPFCPHCYETSNIKRHMQQFAVTRGQNAWYCSVCKLSVRLS
ncbi:hypothetical protein I5504_04975 [Citrobacter koseri]|uniref:hypothetical protein n=1 Tax=Citrobacter koseri TaxID=545 RepID=UPI000E16701B|nr:hypothetical protein [Citrobacter koseri]MBJ9302415.1 hypothetical protein [Citrobacter koseri]MBJ9366921.1 hypothetical protein [Citrobacter koseri]SUX90289.1 Uncharacterised protein [Citrobacter koseri]HAT2783830.1 hypothetical protein [Citrobacter koseri]HAT3905048.1 hypothetical protein [Citrobacter koseri]